MRHHLLPIACVFAAAFGVACGSADPLGPSRTESVHPLSSPAEVSGLGFSLGQALPKQGYRGTLTWGTQPQGVTFSPAATKTSVTWSLALPEAGSVPANMEEVDVHCDRSRFVTNTNLCSSYLQATLILNLSTGDGALSGQLPVVFQAYSPNNTSWSDATVDLSEFTGTFRIAASVGEPSTLRVEADGSVQGNESDGSLIGSLVLGQQKISSRESTGEGLTFEVAGWKNGGGTVQP